MVLPLVVKMEQLEFGKVLFPSLLHPLPLFPFYFLPIPPSIFHYYLSSLPLPPSSPSFLRFSVYSSDMPAMCLSLVCHCFL